MKVDTIKNYIPEYDAIKYENDRSSSMDNFNKRISIKYAINIPSLPNIFRIVGGNKDSTFSDTNFLKNRNETKLSGTYSREVSTIYDATTQAIESEIGNISINNEYIDFIYRMIKRDTFELGYINETIDFFMKEVVTNRENLISSISNMLIKYSKDDELWIDTLYALSHLKYEHLVPHGVMIAGSALCRKNIRIKEMAIVMFEEWRNVEALEFLKEMETGVPWLDKYVDAVINDIERVINRDGVSA